MNIKRLQDKSSPQFTSIIFTTFDQKNLTTSLCGRVQNNSMCFKGEYNDRQTRKIGHNIPSLSLLSLPFITLLLSLAHTHTHMSGKAGWEALAQPQSTGPSPNKETINHVWAAVWVSALWTTTTLSHLSPLEAGQPASTPRRHALSHPHTLTDVEEKCTTYFQINSNAPMQSVHTLMDAFGSSCEWHLAMHGHTQVLFCHPNQIDVSTS